MAMKMFCILILLFAANSHAVVLFDNGSFGGSQVGRNYRGSVFTMWDDFYLPFASTITQIDWSGNEEQITTVPLTANFGIWTSLSSPAGQIFSGSGIPIKVESGNIVSPGEAYIDFNYTLSGLSLSLPAGTFFIELNVVADPSGGLHMGSNSRDSTDDPRTLSE